MRRCSAAPAWLACLLAGCGGPGPVTVAGEVTFGGRPLREGTIRFAPADGRGTTQAARVEDGKFTTQLQPMSYLVQISAPKPRAKPARPEEKGPDGGPTVEELLPARYNTRSELKLDVTGPRGDVRFDLGGE